MTVDLRANSDGLTSTEWSDEAATPISVTLEEKYQITLQVRDSVNGTLITGATMDILVGTTSVYSDVVFDDDTNPYIFYLEYDTYTIEFEKDLYVSYAEEKTPNYNEDGADGTYDNEIAWTINMTTITESLADYQVLTNFVYDENNDVLHASVYMERRGQQVLSDAVRTLQTCTLEIYDSTDTTSPMYTTSRSSPQDESIGVYWFTITNAVTSEGFQSGRTYFAKISIVYGAGGTSNVTYTDSTTFDIGVTARLKEWTEDIQEEVADVKTDIATAATATQTVVGTAQTSIESVVSTTASTTQDTVASETSSAVTTIQSAISSTESTLEDTIAAEGSSRILNQESYIRQNDSLTIRYKTTTDLKPTITVYDATNTIQVSGATMTEGVSGSGIYEYTVTFSYGTGEHTIICQESTLGTLDGINIEVITTDLEDISATATTTMAQLMDIDTDQMELLSTSITDINKVISGIIGNIDELAELSTKVSELADKTSEAIYGELEVAMEKLKEINEGQGIKIEEMYEMSEDQSTDVDYIKNKALEIKALVELSQEILTRTSDEPIVKTWMESAGLPGEETGLEEESETEESEIETEEAPKSELELELEKLENLLGTE